MKRPIMLWITSRSRSSLVSKMFINHDVWWGNTKVKQHWTDADGQQSYVSYENQNIKKLLKLYKEYFWKKVHLTPVFPVAGFEIRLAEIVPDDKIWMMKTGVEYFNAFKGLNPYNIFILRNPRDVAHSLRQKTKARYHVALRSAQWRFAYMKRLQSEYGGVFVNTDNIIQNDFSEIKEAIEYCGLTYDEEAAREAIVR